MNTSPSQANKTPLAIPSLVSLPSAIYLFLSDWHSVFFGAAVALFFALCVFYRQTIWRAWQVPKARNTIICGAAFGLLLYVAIVVTSTSERSAAMTQDLFLVAFILTVGISRKAEKYALS